MSEVSYMQMNSSNLFGARVEWEQFDVDIEKNTSRLRIIKIEATATGNVQSGYQARTGGIKINGVEKATATQNAPFSVTLYAGKWTTIDLFSVPVHMESDVLQHNTDGTLTVKVESTLNIHQGTWGTPMNFGGFVDIELPAIPRASKMAVAGGELGTQHTIFVTKGNENFTNTLEYRCGTHTVTVTNRKETLPTKEEWTYTPPKSHADANTEGGTVNVTYTLTTKNGDTVVGITEETVECAIPASVKPTCSIDSVTDLAGLFGRFGKYVQSASRLQIDGTAAGKYGSTITESKISVDGKVLDGTSATTSELALAGTGKIVLTVKDSRGRTGTAEAEIDVYPYMAPVIKNLEVIRVATQYDTSPDDQGEWIRVSCGGDISNMDGQTTLTLTASIRRKGQEQWEATSPIENGYAVFHAAPDETFEVMVTASDTIAVTENIQVVGTVYATIDLLPGGHGVTVGGIAEREGFVCKMDAVFEETVYIGTQTLEEYIRSIIG